MTVSPRRKLVAAIWATSRPVSDAATGLFAVLLGLTRSPARMLARRLPLLSACIGVQFSDFTVGSEVAEEASLLSVVGTELIAKKRTVSSAPHLQFPVYDRQHNGAMCAS
jgi:hypothetical protein